MVTGVPAPKLIPPPAGPSASGCFRYPARAGRRAVDGPGAGASSEVWRERPQERQCLREAIRLREEGRTQQGPVKLEQARMLLMDRAGRGEAKAVTSTFPARSVIGGLRHHDGLIAMRPHRDDGRPHPHQLLDGADIVACRAWQVLKAPGV